MNILKLHGVMAAGLMAVALDAPVSAQQPADASKPAAEAPKPAASKPIPSMQPAPTLVPGRGDIPSAEIGKRLANVAPPPMGVAEDKLPKLTVPKGYSVEVVAHGIGNARTLRIGDKGTIFVSTRLLDKVYAITPDKSGKRETKLIASGMDRPNGLAFHKGSLYVAEGTKISRFDNIEDNLDNPPKPVVIYDDLPNHQSHGWRYIGIGPDDKLYINVGAPCNICEPPPGHAQIRRMNLDGSGAEVYAVGVRNSVGFDWHPVTKELYFTEHGRDWLSEDLPEDELNRVTKQGQHFGFPYCHNGTFTDREMGWGKSCSNYVNPAALLGPHSSPLGMRFYTGNMFPGYKGAIFIARHGSWNRTKKTGADIWVVRLNPNGTVKSQEVFMTGFMVDNAYLGRPVDVAVMKDGSMLVSDDHAGAVYRVTYGAQKR
jgi:glucose/arabinose dehydrogenase